MWIKHAHIRDYITLLRHGIKLLIVSTLLRDLVHVFQNHCYWNVPKKHYIAANRVTHASLENQHRIAHFEWISRMHCTFMGCVSACRRIPETHGWPWQQIFYCTCWSGRWLHHRCFGVVQRKTSVRVKLTKTTTIQIMNHVWLRLCEDKTTFPRVIQVRSDRVCEPLNLPFQEHIRSESRQVWTTAFWVRDFPQGEDQRSELGV